MFKSVILFSFVSLPGAGDCEGTFQPQGKLAPVLTQHTAETSLFPFQRRVWTLDRWQLASNKNIGNCN